MVRRNTLSCLRRLRRSSRVQARFFCGALKGRLPYQYLRQLRKAQGGLSGMDTAQAGDPVENLGQ